MAGLIGSQGYQQASQVFNPQTTQTDLQQNPLISELKKMQDVARRKAYSSVQQGFDRSGFGKSTFAPQAAASAGTQASQGYAPQIAQAGQQQQQNQIQNFMKLLGLETGERRFQTGLNEQRRQADMGFGLGAAKAGGEFLGGLDINNIFGRSPMQQASYDSGGYGAGSPQSGGGGFDFGKAALKTGAAMIPGVGPLLSMFL